jgi:hypothetical protein
MLLIVLVLVALLQILILVFPDKWYIVLEAFYGDDGKIGIYTLKEIGVGGIRVHACFAFFVILALIASGSSTLVPDFLHLCKIIKDFL